MKRTISLSSPRDHIRPSRVCQQEEGRKCCFASLWTDSREQPPTPSTLPDGSVYVGCEKHETETTNTGGRCSSQKRKRMAKRSLATGTLPYCHFWRVPVQTTLQDVVRICTGLSVSWGRGTVAIQATGSSSADNMRASRIRQNNARVRAIETQQKTLERMLPDSLMVRLGIGWKDIPPEREPTEQERLERSRNSKMGGWHNAGPEWQPATQGQWTWACRKYIGFRPLWLWLQDQWAEAFCSGGDSQEWERKIRTLRAWIDNRIEDEWVRERTEESDFQAESGETEEKPFLFSDSRTAAEYKQIAAEYAAMISVFKGKWQETQDGVILSSSNPSGPALYTERPLLVDNGSTFTIRSHDEHFGWCVG